MMFLRLVFVLILLGSCLSEEDSLPCEMEGNWIFEVGHGGYDNTINCLTTGEIAREYSILLEYPNVVKDHFGRAGSWTMVGNMGFEVFVHGRKFFAYVGLEDGLEEFCNETSRGSSHNVLGRDWSCFFGRKVSATPSASRALKELLRRDTRSTNNELPRKELQRRMYKTELDMIGFINAAQSSWTAANYDEYDTMTVDELLSKAGYRLHRKKRIVTSAPITKKKEELAEKLPRSFDWRNVNGINYITPVRDQGKCGSCYAFALAAMNEARLAIYTNRSVQVILSPQDVVDCTFYTFGCVGGSAYAIAGKYAEDYGMVEEECNPYKAVKSRWCGTRTSCERYYFTGYEYIGGYYGACNETKMMLALVKYGPLAIGIKVEEDLMFYKSGIYSPTGISSKFNSFVMVDHEVTLVGYGVDRTHGKYWIIKNSWGTEWGDNGFFSLRRGINECGVESDAVQSFPIF